MTEERAQYTVWLDAICPKCGSTAAVTLPYASMGYLTGDMILCYACGQVNFMRNNGQQRDNPTKTTEAR